MRDTALPGLVRHRVKGRPALVRRLMAVHLAVLRFGRHRARSHEDRVWAQRTSDALAAVVEVAADDVGHGRGGPEPYAHRSTTTI